MLLTGPIKGTLPQRKSNGPIIVMASSELKVVQSSVFFDLAASPTSCEQAELNAAALNVRNCLDRARGADVPAALIEALDCILSHALKRTEPRLSYAHSELIFDAMNRSRMPIRDFLDARTSYDDVRRGLDAVAALLIHWGEADEVRAARCPDIVPDMRDYAEVFRNQIQNATLLAAIQRRSDERIDDPVAAFHPVFSEHLA